jgi:hypothetical protein
MSIVPNGSVAPLGAIPGFTREHFLLGVDGREYGVGNVCNPLLYCLEENCRPNIVKEVIEIGGRLGVDPVLLFELQNDSVETVLHKTCESSVPEVVKVVLEVPEVVRLALNKRNSNGRTPLNLATRNHGDERRRIIGSVIPVFGTLC